MFSGEGLPFTRHSDVLNAQPADDESRVRLIAELKRRGNSAFQKKLFDEAEVLYSRAIEHNLNNLQNDQHIFYGNRSASRCSMGKFKEALSDADLCVELAPEWAKGYFRQAQALTKLGRHNEALAKLESAKKLEPENKSVATLYDQVKQASVVDVPEKNNFKPTTKKVTRVEISSTENASVKVHSKPSGTVHEDEESALGNVRGYKKLADGRVTTYFNNELNEETKQLIGDITPKRVGDPQVVQIKNVDGASAWNQGNTFEEKDMSSWAKSKLETLFEHLVTSCQSGDLSGMIKIDEICDISGDASIAVVRGAKRYIFDFSFKLKCSLHLDNKAEPVHAELRFLDMSSDCMGDYDIEVVVPSRYSEPTGKTFYDILVSTSSSIRKAVAERLTTFVTEYHTF